MPRMPLHYTRSTAEIPQKALQEHGFGSARLSIEDKTEQNGRNTAVQDSDPCLGCIECFGRAGLWKRSPLRMHGMLRQCKTMEYRTKRKRTKHISRNHRDPCLRCIECFGRARLYGRQNIECFGNASGGQDYGRQNVECFGSARQWNTGQDKTDETHLDHTWRCPCEPAQLKCPWTLRMQHITRESTAKMLRTRISTHTVCETAQSKFTRTLR